MATIQDTLLSAFGVSLLAICALKFVPEIHPCRLKGPVFLRCLQLGLRLWPPRLQRRRRRRRREPASPRRQPPRPLPPAEAAESPLHLVPGQMFKL